MSSVDLFHEERGIIETVLGILETLLGRLNTWEPVPNAILGDVIDLLRQFEHAACDASDTSEGHPCLSACVAQHELARVLLRRMQYALEAVERGEAGAVGAFVISSRGYIRARRDHMCRDHAYSPKPSAGILATGESQSMPIQEQALHPAVVRRLSRLVEQYRAMANASTVVSRRDNHW